MAACAWTCVSVWTTARNGVVGSCVWIASASFWYWMVGAQVWLLTGHCDPCRVCPGLGCWFWVGGFAGSFALWLAGFASAFALASYGFVGCSSVCVLRRRLCLWSVGLCWALSVHCALLLCLAFALLLGGRSAQALEEVEEVQSMWCGSRAAPCAKKFCQKFLDDVLDDWLQNR